MFIAYRLLFFSVQRTAFFYYHSFLVKNTQFHKKLTVNHFVIQYIYADTIFVNRLIVMFNRIMLQKGIIGMDGQEIKVALGQNIKNLRSHRRYSQAELAEKVDISIIYLSNIERGKKFPKPAILSQLADGLDVQVYELFKPNHTPKVVVSDDKKLISRISRDITQKVIHAMETGFKKYV